MHLVREKSSLPRLLVFPFGLVALLGLALVRFQPGLVLRLAHCPLRDMTGVVATMAPGLRRELVLTDREKKTARLLAVVLLVAGWLFQLRAG